MEALLLPVQSIIAPGILKKIILTECLHLYIGLKENRRDVKVSQHSFDMDNKKGQKGDQKELKHIFHYLIITVRI